MSPKLTDAYIGLKAIKKGGCYDGLGGFIERSDEPYFDYQLHNYYLNLRIIITFISEVEFVE